MLDKADGRVTLPGKQRDCPSGKEKRDVCLVGIERRTVAIDHILEGSPGQKVIVQAALDRN